jgi:hypothetical protein
MPRPYQDATLRYRKHGPIRPMEQPGFAAWLLRRVVAAIRPIARG